MIIQNVLLPKAGICNMEELYFRREENREKTWIFIPRRKYSFSKNRA